MAYTNPEIKTKDISFLKFMVRLRNDHQSTRNLQLVIW